LIPMALVITTESKSKTARIPLEIAVASEVFKDMLKCGSGGAEVDEPVATVLQEQIDPLGSSV
jgi:hypothetical protein